MLYMVLQQQQAEEEDRLLQRAIEASRQELQAQNPDRPDVDRMNYEQLLELGENAGQVNRGYSEQQLSTIPTSEWLQPSSTESDQCQICMEAFEGGKQFKKLRCGHEYDAKCIDTWLKKEKRCPICSLPPLD